MSDSQVAAAESSPNLEMEEKSQRRDGSNEKVDGQTSSTGSIEALPAPENASKPNNSNHFMLPQSLKWIPANWNWSKIQPVIRCAISAWISAILFVIPRIELFMGQASFLILIAGFLSTPSDPFMSVLEREILILFFSTTAWAWSCLGILFADLARHNRDSNVKTKAVFSGQYIEAGPSIILAVFIFLGTTFLLYVKARQGPGPYFFGTVFGCICLDICLTTAALFPYPLYSIGKAILLPLSFHSAIALLCSLLIFPSSMSAQFTNRLQEVFSPLATSLSLHRTLLQTCLKDSESASSDSFIAIVSAIKSSVNQSEGALNPLAAAARLLKDDFIYDRFAPLDYKPMHELARRLAVRANGMTVYFQLIDVTRERFPVTPVVSRVGTPLHSRPPSPERELGREDIRPRTDPGGGARKEDVETSSLTTPTSSTFILRKRNLALDAQSHTSSQPHLHGPAKAHTHYGHQHHQHHQHHHGLLQNSLHHLTHMSHVPKGEEAVGVFESQRYLNLEATHLYNPESAKHTKQTLVLLEESCGVLLERCENSINVAVGWLGQVREGRFKFWVGGAGRRRVQKERLEKIEKVRDDLASTLETFKSNGRHRILDPYLGALDPEHSPSDEIPPHRHLFHCYVYQYHLLQFAVLISQLLDNVIQLETDRRPNRLWVPVPKIFTWNIWEPSESLDHEDDENPDVIQGMEPSWTADLGMPRPRDPDALPPNNTFEWMMNHFYHMVFGFGGGNVLFALKGALLTVILCIPSLLESSAAFAYRNRFVWAIFMGQLTTARFRGDTTFGLVARILSTFLGGVLGMVMWYISAGSGHGNAIGLAAVTGFSFPFFFYARLYWPGPPLTNIIFFVTAILVVGYSYQDQHIILLSSPGFGVTVAWRRFVLVTVGVFGAFVFSFFPPSTTIRLYHRNTLATTSSEIGSLYCSILSYANQRRDADAHEIITSLIAIRSKLKRSILLRANIVYEFSLQGKWPAKRYHMILDLQLQIAYSLSHLMSVVEHLEPAWSLAFLRRCRFLDSDFQGDVLAVISMVSTSLRTGNPLPQITPCPLLDRFMLHHHGLNVIHAESEDDYGLPRTLTLDTLRNEQYMIFCVGVSTAYGIITRLDRLMVATKEVVGEQYHIHGIGLDILPRAGGVELGLQTNTVQFQNV